MLAIISVCGRAAHPSPLGNLYTGRAKIALSSSSQPFLSHHMLHKHKKIFTSSKRPHGSRHLLFFGGTSIPVADWCEILSPGLSQCCCPELDVSCEFSFQDASNESWPGRHPCPRKDTEAGRAGSTLLDCLEVQQVGKRWREGKDTQSCAIFNLGRKNNLCASQ